LANCIGIIIGHKHQNSAYKVKQGEKEDEKEHPDNCVHIDTDAKEPGHSVGECKHGAKATITIAVDLVIELVIVCA